MSRRRRWAAGGASLALLLSPVAVPAGAAGATIEVNLKAVGHIDLAGGGSPDDVAVVGTTAVVSSAGAGCAPSSATLVDVGDPARPRVAGTVAVPDGLAVAGLDAARVTTAAFRGDLLALALRSCRPGAAGAGVRFFDVSQPADPRALGAIVAGDPQSVSLVLRPDGRALAATVVTGTGAGGPVVEVDDATDPTRPAPLARWTRPAGDAPACPVASADATLAEGGGRAVVAFDDGTVYELDLDDPARPAVAGAAQGRPGEGRDPHATSVPVGRRTLAVVSEGEGPDPGCGATSPDRGVRLLAMQPPASMAELVTVRYPSPAAPGRLVASGELAYVAWHADGLRVLDLGQLQPPTVAQFVPPGPAADVVGVGVLDAYLVVADARSGLYVLERPAEGVRESWWSKLKGAAGFMSVPLLLGAVWAVPRLAMGTSPAASRSRVPAGAPVARRRRS